jgi:hypothetical protein
VTATPDKIPSDLTLEIGDDVSPEEFIAATRAFLSYVKDVADIVEQSGEQIKWTVVVREGSSLIGVAPLPSVPPTALRAVYSKVASGIESVRRGQVEESGLPDAALKHLRTLSDLSSADKHKPVSLRVWVEKKPVAMTNEISRAITEDWRADYSDFGTVEGKLEAIQDRGSLLIQVRDPLFNTSIKCYFPEVMLGDAFANFRKRIEISGTIHYRKNGVPISIEAVSIDTLPDDADLPSAKDVRGLFGASA